jgi:hypothetical protein
MGCLSKFGSYKLVLILFCIFMPTELYYFENICALRLIFLSCTQYATHVLIMYIELSHSLLMM